MFARRIFKIPHAVYYRTQTHPWSSSTVGKLYMNAVIASTVVFGEMGLCIGLESAIKENSFMKFYSGVSGGMIGMTFAPLWPVSLLMLTCYRFKKNIS